MTSLQQQRARGVLFSALALFIAVNAVLDFRQGLNFNAISEIVAAGFLTYLAWGQLQPTREITIPTSDERTQAEIRTASSTAFWSLMMVLMVQSTYDVIPSTMETTVYMIVAMVFLGLAWGYEKISHTK